MCAPFTAAAERTAADRGSCCRWRGRLPTVTESGKLLAVDGVIATAFQFWLVISTDCELFGRTPSDQYGSSQKPLVGLVQLFAPPLWPETVTRDRRNVRKRQAARLPGILGRCIVRLIPHVEYRKTNGVNTDVKLAHRERASTNLLRCADRIVACELRQWTRIGAAR